MGWSPAERLEQAYSGLTGPGLGRIKKETIGSLRDGPWQIVPVRDVLRVPASGSHAVSAWPWSVHCTITGRWADILSTMPGVKNPHLQHSKMWVKFDPCKNSSNICRRVCVHTTNITNQKQQSTPIDIQFCAAWLVIKTMSSAKCGAKNEGIRDTCSFYTFGKLISPGNTDTSRPHIE